MEDEELVKMFNPTLKRGKTILLFLIVVINGLIWIVSDIGLQNVRKGEVNGGGIKNGNELASWILHFYYGKWRVVNLLNGLSIWAFSFFSNSLSPLIV